MADVIVTTNQSLLDIAIQECGTIDALLELALLNGLSITDVLEVGTKLQTGTNIKNIDLLSFFDTNGLWVATALTAEDLFNAAPEGIDYMIIGTDFIVA